MNYVIVCTFKIDVNIHPTKHEVRFLYQDDIINKIQSCFEQKLLNSDVSRTYYVKSLTLDPFINTNTLNTKKSEDEKDREQNKDSDAAKKVINKIS